MRYRLKLPLALAVIVLLAFTRTTNAGWVAVTNAYLGTYDHSWGPSGDQIATWLDELVTNTADRLVIFTQCYGGNMVSNFNGKTNTCVLSATSPGQEAEYGRYDTHAIHVLNPESNNTAELVHSNGVHYKGPTETPMTGGGLSPAQFPLDPVSPAGPVKSRHVIFYAGQPRYGMQGDTEQAQTLGFRFAVGPFGLIVLLGDTIGGPKGNAKGLRDAIGSAGQAITNSPNPDDEQLVLVIGDHGGVRVTYEFVTNAVVPPSTNWVVTPPVNTLSTNTVSPGSVLGDGKSRPGFSIIVPMTNGVTIPGGTNFVSHFPPFSWQFQGRDHNNPAFQFNLNAFEERPIEADNDIIGDAPGEGIALFFPMDRDVFVACFDRVLDVTIRNQTGVPQAISGISHDTGPISKRFAPTFLAIAANPNPPQPIVSLTWEALARQPFQVEVASSLTGAWNNAGGPTNNTSGAFSNTFPLAFPQGFFRIRTLP